MEKIHIGYVQGVHGLRGDLKIKNRFENPDLIFQKGNRILLNEEEHEITHSKFYKGFYLVTIDNLKHINLVEHYKGYDVYFYKSDLKLGKNEYILDDLYGLKIESDGKSYGTVKDILDNGKYKILVIDYKNNFMIPLVNEYVTDVDLENGIIHVKDIEGLII